MWAKYQWDMGYSSRLPPNEPSILVLRILTDVRIGKTINNFNIFKKNEIDKRKE